MRTTIAEVRALITTTLTDAGVTAYITAANNFVTAHLDGLLDDDLLAEIERWIAAHYIAGTQERMAKREEAGTAKVEYIGEAAMGLNATFYGQTAIGLDTTGTLSQVSKGNGQIEILTL
jgi:hypothetical protein